MNSDEQQQSGSTENFQKQVQVPSRDATGDRGYFFVLGKEAGRAELCAEIVSALGILDLIAAAFKAHEDSYHAD